MSYETVGVVRLRPDVTWAQVLALYDPQADPAKHFHDESWESSWLSYDAEDHAVSYTLDTTSYWIRKFIQKLEPLAREGWTSIPEAWEPRFFGPDPDATALRYWTEQLKEAQAAVEFYSGRP